MTSFDFFCLGRVVFGRRALDRIGPLAAGLGRRTLVVANAGQPGDGGVADRLAGLLAADGVAVTWCQQRGEPTKITRYSLPYLCRMSNRRCWPLGPPRAIR